MKISFLGFDLLEGKVKYNDERLKALADKFSPKKVTPFFVEFIKGDFEKSDGIVLSREKTLDLFILDMDKLDTRSQRTESAQEKELIKKCMAKLEEEVPLCDVVFTPEESAIIKMIAPYSLKPTIIEENEPEASDIVEKLLQKAETVFFYTAGEKEVRAWPVDKGSDIVSCAGKIHSDLARGFIKADIVSFDNFIGEHNMQAAKTKGLVALVGKDYIIKDGDIIEIRFNV
ncbi:MAG: DUF933 domain-containing protein [Candidatus Omnitrophica bacterium]|nr:DUF933 domain-containing protein [Candidatus Omnitrophota bacterium]